jgi:hypothetical protein
MGASTEDAAEIAEEIERAIYDGIESKKILRMVFRLLGKRRIAVKSIVDLRQALSLMQPKPDFEKYIQILLRERGYSVSSSQIVRGRCSSHEVDAIATKNDEACIVEVKHHVNLHARTGLDESRIAWAILVDVNEAYENRLSDLKIDKAMIVTNTKFSEEAKSYGECRGILQFGWGTPQGGGLQSWIDEKRFYPITYLKGLRKADRERLASSGIILLSQLMSVHPKDVARRSGVSEETVRTIIGNTRAILSES